MDTADDNKNIKMLKDELCVKTAESGLSFPFIFLLTFYFLFNLLSISLFLELRVRIRTEILPSHISHGNRDSHKSQGT